MAIVGLRLLTERVSHTPIEPVATKEREDTYEIQLGAYQFHLANN